MTRSMFLCTAMAALSGCGFNPTGPWTGDFSLFAEDGSTYTNSLDVDEDETVSARMYFTDYDPELDADVIYYVDFDGSWSVEDGAARFALGCSFADCDLDLAMTCDPDGDTMICATTPEFYTDRDVVWVEAN